MYKATQRPFSLPVFPVESVPVHHSIPVVRAGLPCLGYANDVATRCPFVKF